jgi:hypothetical protein
VWSRIGDRSRTFVIPVKPRFETCEIVLGARLTESIDAKSPSIKSSGAGLEARVVLYLSTETGREGLRWIQADYQELSAIVEGACGGDFLRILSWNG